MRKYLLIILILCALLPTFSVKADENEDVLGAPNMSGVIEALPEEFRDILPEGSENILNSPEKIGELFSTEYVFSFSKGLFKSAFSSALKTFLIIASVSIVTAVLSLVGSSFSQDSGAMRVWSLAGALAVGSATYFLVRSQLENVVAFSKNISDFMKALSGVMAGVSLSAGEVTSSAASTLWVFSLSGTVEEISSKLLLPIMQISFSATLMTNVMQGVNISRFVQMIRNIFLSMLVFFMTVFSVILSFQSIVSHSSDTLAMRGMRYMISHSVPVIGGLVSESARTMATSISLVKDTVGFFGVFLVLLLTLYPLISLIAARYALRLAGAFSSIICEDKSTLFLDETLKMLDFLVAIVIIIALSFIFCLSLFTLLPACGA